MENGLFSRSGKHSAKVKWEKNIFRTGVVVACTLIAWLGAADLDKFVSLIGSVAWCVFPFSLVLASHGTLTNSFPSVSHFASATVGPFRYKSAPSIL